MSKINGLSQQFVGDVNVVLDEYKNDTLVQFQLGVIVSGIHCLNKN